MKPPEPDWIEHLSIIIPGVMFAFKLLISVITFIGGALCTVIWRIGSQFVNKVSSMDTKVHNVDSKLDVLQHVMLSCDGCASSMAKYGRRREDVLDSEVD